MPAANLEIIPVLDLRNGVVVHAKYGERHLYAPIKSTLAASSEPADIVAGLLDLYPFQKIYIADLDAIEGRGNQSAAIAELERRFPELRFWVDAGIRTEEQIAAWLASHRADLVLGSENLTGTQLLEEVRHTPRILLSLDSRGDTRLGPYQLFEDAKLWPQSVIVVTLGRVGSLAGPDIDQLLSMLACSKGRHHIYAAGGVRDRRDLETLQRIGAAGVLVASALHDGSLKPEDLKLAS